jgi:hypothetical protein
MNKSRIGLNRKDAEKALRSFFGSNDAGVLAVKGDWGVGKTYLVKKTFADLKIEYFYSSVFGATSISDIKVQFWESFKLFKEIAGRSKFWNRSKFGLTQKDLEDAGKIAEKIFSLGATSPTISLINNVLLEKILRGKVIFLDDIERTSSKLSIDEILGFVEKLAEEYQCKVILVYNEDRLEVESKNKLHKYREKVIDFEILFNPELDENFHIVFDESSCGEVEKNVLDYLKNNNIQTGNIRILNKIKWGLKKIKTYIKDFDPIVKKEIVEELLLILLSKFDSGFPLKISDLLTLSSQRSVDTSNTSDASRDLFWKASRLGWSASGLTNEMIQLVETSEFNHENFLELGRFLDEREKQRKIRAKLRNAYSSYQMSFGDVENELKSKLILFLEENLFFLEMHEIGGLEAIAEAVDLDLRTYKVKWLLNEISQARDLNALNDLRLMCSQYFPDLNSRLDERAKELNGDLNISDVLRNMFSQDVSHSGDVNYLAQITVEQYKEWLIRGDADLKDMVNRGLKIGDQASRNLKNAIIELSKTSKLNAVRAKYLYNIEISETSDG